MADRQLEDLFRACDQKGTGLIGPEEFRELCADFDIVGSDSDTIFQDLDYDGDGRISIDDFAWGFKNFLKPEELPEPETSGFTRRRPSEAQAAWGQLVTGVGEATVNRFLNNSGKKLANLYQELQTVDTNPQLVTHFEKALSSLVDDVKILQDDNHKLEEMFKRERENHLHKLRGLEEELDAQVARVEAQAEENARNKFDQEKRVLVKRMEAETMELKTHLKLFQKVNDMLTAERKKANELDLQSTENENLRSMLSDTKANLELIRAEMVKLKSEYERKCKELNSQQELLILHMNKNEQIQQQSMQSNLSGSSSTISLLANEPNVIIVESNCRTQTPFGIERLMEDVDSGHSTAKDIDCDSETKSVKSFQEVSSGNSKNEVSSISESTYDSSYTQPNGPPERSYKILFTGDAAVGKTYFIHRFCKGHFPNKLGSTVGIDYRVKTIRVDDKIVALNLWDTAGQERFRSMTRSYFRRSDGVMLLYDVTSEQSFLNIRQWIPSIEEISEKRIPIVLCGNKVDTREQAIREGKTCVNKEQGAKLAAEYSAIFLETSSKTGQNITDAIIALTREMLTREDVEVKISALQIKSADKANSCCSKK